MKSFVRGSFILYSIAIQVQSIDSCSHDCVIYSKCGVILILASTKQSSKLKQNKQTNKYLSHIFVF